jgi:hypothetical protein
MVLNLVIKAENPPVFKPGMRGHLHEYKQKEDRHAPCRYMRMESKLSGFDKSGAWPTHVNFQPWP